MPILRINQLHEIYLQCGVRGDASRVTKPYNLTRNNRDARRVASYMAL